MRSIVIVSLVGACMLLSCGSDSEDGEPGTPASGGTGGSAGASGTAGAPQTGGSGGSAGASGEGGTGGGAGGGTGGTAGASGDAGAAGQAGMAGAAGDGGSAGSGSVPSGTFLSDQDGYVVFQIESIADDSPPAPWVYRTTGPCDTPSECEPLGSGYYQYEGADLCSQDQSGNGVMQIQFEVKTTGTYRVVWRNLRDHRDGSCGNDRNNDSFMAFPTTKSDDKFKVPFKVYGGGSGTWNWSATYDIHEEKEKVCLDFDAGVHSMEIHGRSRDHAIDKVALFRVEGSLADCRNAGTAGLDAYPETGIAP